jgi:branched-subunit amino acid transport protein AzlD
MKKRKFQFFPADAKSFGDKAVIVLGKGLPVALMLVLLLSAFQVIPSPLQRGVAAAPFIANLLGFIVVVASGVWVYGIVKDKNYLTKSDTANALIAFGGFAFGFLCMAGFSF